MNKKIIIITADPNSINSEIISKMWKKISNNTRKKIYLVGNYNLINRQFKKIKLVQKVIQVKNLSDHSFSPNLKIIDVPLDFKDPFKVSFKSASKYLIRSFRLANKLVKEKDVKGLINCPINKKLIEKTNKVGVTEFFASICKVIDKSEIMMIYNKSLSVVPLTTHIDLKDIPKKITKTLIIKKIESLNKNFKKIFKKKPRIGVLGLNPHNGELRKNSEEVKIILPAILDLKKKGINLKGPLVCDTSFIINHKNYDVIVGMYHDQVLTPFKTLFHYDAINLTLGLPYIRISPDHGPATDLIGKNRGNPTSLYNCVKFLVNF
tara:strand:+ start:41 stop:1003 length:963 start_codon:yes stop_codon:yes gene_type:complete